MTSNSKSEGCDSISGLRRSSPQNGNIRGSDRRLLPNWFRVSRIWCPETLRRIARARQRRAFLLLAGVLSLTSGLAGWRRSADRASLRANSLLTGNLTGKFAIPRPPGADLKQKTPAPQPLLIKFPTKINRENISKNREISERNSDFKAGRAA